ncbi:MAG TPA: glycerophosphodiester phosphodiesterase family protein [Fimbriiglobus sp.]|jgi:glycerophosphoryl diester phosphodiesterase
MRLALGGLISLLAILPAAAQSKFAFFEPVQPPRNVQIMAHRGMHMLAPDNSLAAILGCASDYVEWAEIEVHLTKDGKHVAIHGESLASCTDGKGKVADFTLEELKKLDAGSWFAPRFRGTRLSTLPEVLAAAKGKVNLYLDCKRIDPDRLVREIKATGMESQVIVYGDPNVLAKVRASGENAVPTMTKYRAKTDLAEFVRSIDPAAVEIDADEVTAEICKAFHERGIKVQAKVLGTKWDNPTVWGKVIDAGVDWLQTDDPAVLRFFDTRRRIGKFPVEIALHRGANRYAPENTLPAIREASRLGADYAEFDIRTTRDGRHVIMHDGTVDRTTGFHSTVRAMSFADVTKLSAGAWFGKPFADSRVPAFEDVLTALGDKTGAYLDSKDIAPEALAAAIRKFGLYDRHVVYQSKEYCAKLLAIDPKVRPLPPLGRFDQLDAVAAIKPYGFDTKWGILSKDMIAAAHAKGVKVFSDALGLNETVEQYRKAMGWGIDVIQTDHPLRVLRAIELVSAEKR